MFTLRIEEQYPENWNNILLSGKTDSLFLYHSTPWADRLVELLRYQPLFFSVYKEERIQFMLLGFIEPLINLADKPSVKTMARKMAGILLGRRNFFWYGQPVYFTESDSAGYTFLANSLHQFMKKKNLRLSHGEWPAGHETALPANWKVKKWATLKVDLSEDEDAIFASFKQTARKEVKKAHKQGIEVRKVDSLDELETYYKFATECAKRYKKKLLGFTDFSTMWKHFRGWGHFETFVAHHDHQMIGGLSVWGDQYYLMEIGSFQSEKAFQEKLASSDIVKWEAIRWGKAIGARSFDLAGINPYPETEKEQGIRKFKEKWSHAEYTYDIISM